MTRLSFSPPDGTVLSVLDLGDLLGALDLEPTGEGRYRAENGAADRPVFGGQLLAQSVVAASRAHPDMVLKTLHTVFARAARPEAPLDIVVEPFHAGRTFATVTVTIAQGDRACVRSQALLHAEEADLVRFEAPAPEVPGPEEWAPVTTGSWQVRIVGDVDVSDPALVGPPELDVWVRFDGAPDDPVLDQALLAHSTDGFLIATAMRPHPGVGQSQAHVSLATGVISHTLTFHAPAPAGDWLLLSHHSPFAGGGRSYGRADVFRPDGALVASYVQDAMIRPMG